MVVIVSYDGSTHVMPRLFIGWKLPDDVKREIGSVIEPVRKKLPSGSWPKPASYHLTFAFLGDQPESLVDRIGAKMTEVLEGCPQAEVVFTRPGFFPNPKRPRVGWLAVDPEEPLVEAASRIQSALDALKVDRDRKTFRPHLTIVRTRRGWRHPDAKRLLDALANFRSPVAGFDRVSLFASELHTEGAVHTALRTVELK